jgi:hypothetical protein
VDEALEAYVAALEARHLANLTRPELTRALRALSSCYIERRNKLAAGGALDGAGKRAAFALFYGPLHFLTITKIAGALDAGSAAPRAIADLGCGTGVGGAAWALAAGGSPSIVGIDRSAWAATEAAWTYRQFTLRGSARAGDAVRDFPRSPDSTIVLAYAVNEIPEPARSALLDKVAAAAATGAAVFIVEPIAKRDRGWWPAWASRLAAAGVEEREWRFRADLPPLLRQIAKGAGLDPRELTARTLSRL